MIGDEWNFVVGKGSVVYNKLKNSGFPLLGQLADRLYQGLITGADTVFLFKESIQKKNDIISVFSKELNNWVEIEKEILKPVVRSGQIGRYFAHSTVYILYPYKSNAELLCKEEIKKEFPLAWEYLIKNKKVLVNREKGKFKDDKWYRFGRTQNIGLWEQEKIMIPYMVTRLSSYLDISNNYYFVNVTTGGYGLILKAQYRDYKYLQGLLNSKLLDFYLKNISTNFRGGYFAANKQFVESLPIKIIDFINPNDKNLHDKIISLVTSMIETQKQYHAANSEPEKNQLQKKIDLLDNQIDNLVYKLYGLTEEEIKIVEEG